MIYDLRKYFTFPHIYSESFPIIGHFCPKPFGQFICILYIDFNSRTPRDMKHFGNPKNENLLRGPKFYGENEFPVEMCIS